MKVYKVVFHRYYPVGEDLVKQRLDESDIRTVTEGELKAVAEEIAREWLADEIPEFINNTGDFMSATVEVINE